MGFGSVIGLPNSYRSVTTSNYNRFINSHTLQFTKEHAEDFSACCVFTSCCLVAASNCGRSSSSGFSNCHWPQLPAAHSNSSAVL
jgi:hypothetical protein